MSSLRHIVRNSLVLGASFLVLSACTGAEKSAHDGDDDAPKAAAGTPAPTGRSITIEMHTDDSGNYFKPAEVDANPGDVLHFVLVTGVHNVHFLADSNPGVANLPAMSTFAQLPGQAIDIPVTMGPGRYFYQCDPHAMLGMIGHINVTPAQ